MESFLSGRATMAKLPSTTTQPSADHGGFAPLFEPKPVPAAGPPPSSVSSSAPPSDPSPTAAALLPEATPHTHKVSVEVIRVEGAVQGIVVTCKCGERIELDCVY